jgi:hypothetical protein
VGSGGTGGTPSEDVEHLSRVAAMYAQDAIPLGHALILNELKLIGVLVHQVLTVLCGPGSSMQASSSQGVPSRQEQRLAPPPLPPWAGGPTPGCPPTSQGGHFRWPAPEPPYCPHCGEQRAPQLLPPQRLSSAAAVSCRLRLRPDLLAARASTMLGTLERWKLTARDARDIRGVHLCLL